MKALIVKDDGLIYAVEVPEEPRYGKWFYDDSDNMKKSVAYQHVLASAKQNAILCADQEKAARLISQTMGKEAGFGALLLPVGARPRPGIYSIPDLQWEVKESWGPYHENTFPEKVAILKESTPSEPRWETNAVKYAEFLKSHYKEESTPSTEQESQEDLINELLYETYGADLVGREAIAKKFHITRKP